MSNLTSSLTIRLVDDVTGPEKKIAAALRDAAERAKMLSQTMGNTGLSKNFSMNLTRLGMSAKSIAAVSGEWKRYSSAAGLAANAASWTKKQRGEVAAWESSTIGALRAVRREQDALLNAERRAAEHGGSDKLGVGHFAVQAIAAAASVHSIVRTIESAAEAGAHRQHARVEASNAGIGAEELKRIEITAQAAARGAPNMSVTDIIELHKEARSAVQHPEEVFNLIGDLSKAAAILKARGVQEANIADIVKGGESLGLMNDPARFHKYLEGQIKAQAVLGKTISTEQIYEAAKYSKAAGASLSDSFINLVLPSLIQEMHGSSAGNALSGLTKVLRGGLQNRHIPVLKMQELGLLEDPSKIIKTKTGEIKGYGGKVVGDALLASNPFQWFTQYFKPAADKAGYKNLADQTLLLSQILPQVSANLGRIFLQQQATIEQHMKNNEAAAGLDESMANLAGDPLAGIQAMTSALNDLGAAATSPAMAGVGKTFTYISARIRDLAELAETHPTAAITAAAVAGGGALAGAGWFSYQLVNGFGLKSSAIALNEAAGALNGAAGRIGLGGIGAGLGGAAAAEEAAIFSGLSLWKFAGAATAVGAAALAADFALGQFAPDLQKKIHEALANVPNDIAEALKPKNDLDAMFWRAKKVQEGTKFDNTLYNRTGGWLGRPTLPGAADSGDRLADRADVLYRRRQEAMRRGENPYPSLPTQPWRPSFAPDKNASLPGQRADADAQLHEKRAQLEQDIAGRQSGGLDVAAQQAQLDGLNQRIRDIEATMPSAISTTPAPFDRNRSDQIVAQDYGDRRDVFHGDLEQSRENSRGNALGSLGDAADQAKQKLGALDVTVSPNVNMASIDALIAKLQTAQGLLASLGSGGAAGGRASASPRQNSFPSRIG
jgi:hypothetical protein